MRAVGINIEQTNVRITSSSQVTLVWGYLKPINLLQASHGKMISHTKHFQQIEDFVFKKYGYLYEKVRETTKFCT